MFRYMNKRVGVALVVAGAMVLSLLSPAVIQAQIRLDTQHEEVLKSITAEQLAAVMKAEGYTVETASDTTIRWRIDGVNALMILHQGGQSILFHTGFTGTTATLADVNEWNRAWRLSRSYLDNDNDPCLELDLNLTGGVTQASIEAFFETCRESLFVWHTQVVL